MLCSAVHNVALACLPSGAFVRCWVNFDRGDISIGVGQPGSNVCHAWHDPEPIDGIAYAGKMVISKMSTGVCFEGMDACIVAAGDSTVFCFHLDCQD